MLTSAIVLILISLGGGVLLWSVLVASRRAGEIEERWAQPEPEKRPEPALPDEYSAAVDRWLANREESL